MEFRRLVFGDLDRYFENRLRALRLAPSAFLTTYEEEKARGTSHFRETLSHQGTERAIFGALTDKAVVGTIGIFREERPKIRHKAMIWGMYVDVEHRRGGVGAKLLDVALDFARSEMGVAIVNLSVETGNRAARSLYESRGFKCWGTEPKAMFADGRFADEDHMALVF